MESQLANYTLKLTSDNKGILSLLTAIEQSGDNFDPEDSPGKMTDKDSLSVAENFSQLQSQLNLESLEMSGDINLSTFSCCIICGRNPSIENPSETMVDIFTEIYNSGGKSTTLYSVLEDILPLDLDSTRSHAHACVECIDLVNTITRLRAQIDEFIAELRARYDECNKKRSRFPTVSDYTSVLDIKMPLNIFNVKDEESLTMSPGKEGSAGARKSKLQILAETLEGQQMEGDGSGGGSREFDIGDEIDEQLSLNKENEMKPGPEPSVCDKCGNRFKSGKRGAKTTCPACTKEERARSQQKTYTCTHCSKVFKSRASMNEHIGLKHLGNVKTYSCSECSETFTSKHSKSVHERLHKGSKGLTCDECGDSFQTFQSLQYHSSKHTGEFSYHCQSCGKGFNNFKLLEEHSNLHTGHRPYSCDECSLTFANRGSLWLHKRKHNNRKPYVCDYCNKEFGHSSHLVVHKRMHTGETPYRCRFCKEGFISGNHLKRHMRSHQNELPFACGLCKQEFGKRSDLVKHGNSVHNGNVVDDISSAPAPAAPSSPAEKAEYTTILVEEQDRLLLGEGGDQEYVLPVSMLEMEEGGKEIGDQTIVFIQVPAGHTYIQEDQG